MRKILSAISIALPFLFFSGAALAQPGEVLKGKIKGNPANMAVIERLAADFEEIGGIEMSPDGKIIKSIFGKHKQDKGKKIDVSIFELLDRHREAFGLKNPRTELSKFIEYPNGFFTEIQYKQIYNSIPIFGKGYTVDIDKDNNIVGIISSNTPTPNLDTSPSITGEEALNITKKRETTYHASSKLYIFENKLAYYVYYEIGYTGYDFWVDAKTGNIIKRSSHPFGE